MIQTFVQSTLPESKLTWPRSCSQLFEGCDETHKCRNMALATQCEKRMEKGSTEKESVVIWSKHRKRIWWGMSTHPAGGPGPMLFILISEAKIYKHKCAVLNVSEAVVNISRHTLIPSALNVLYNTLQAHSSPFSALLCMKEGSLWIIAVVSLPSGFSSN